MDDGFARFHPPHHRSWSRPFRRCELEIGTFAVFLTFVLLVGFSPFPTSE